MGQQTPIAPIQLSPFPVVGLLLLLVVVFFLTQFKRQPGWNWWWQTCRPLQDSVTISPVLKHTEHSMHRGCSFKISKVRLKTPASMRSMALLSQNNPLQKESIEASSSRSSSSWSSFSPSSDQLKLLQMVLQLAINSAIATGVSIVETEVPGPTAVTRGAASSLWIGLPLNRDCDNGLHS